MTGLVLLAGVVLTWMSHVSMKSMEAGIALLITLAVLPLYGLVRRMFGQRVAASWRY